MAGLGKYKKGAKFTLRSGNKPAFRTMGSSPANMNNFGIGQGGSPWKQDEEEGETSVNPNANNEESNTEEGVYVNPKAKNGENDTDNTNEQGGDAEKKDKAWVKALKIGTTLLSGGIQGVYGGKREYPKINYGKKAEEPTKDPESGVENDVSTKIDKKVDINNENIQNE